VHSDDRGKRMEEAVAVRHAGRERDGLPGDQHAAVEENVKTSDADARRLISVAEIEMRKKESTDWRTESNKHAMAKHRKRFEPKRPARKSAKSLGVQVAEALGNKLNEIADEGSGRTYGEMIAEKLVEDALSGKLPAQVVSKLFEASDARQEPLESTPLSERNTEELKYFVQHGRWPEKSS
jgi:hypothetical protein